MPTTEERVMLLEAKMDEHSRGLAQLREAVVHLEERMDRRFEAIDARFTLQESRFAALEDRIDRRFEAVDVKFESLNGRFDSLDAKVDTRLGRLMAVQITSLAAMLAAFGGIVAALLTR